MPFAAPVINTRLNGVAPHRQGKVRDIYEFGDRLLIVATDRISAFDYVLGSGIPDKGKVLTQISAFWFERTRDIVAEPSALDRRDRVSRPAARRTPTCSRAARCSCGKRIRCRSSASRAAICRVRAGRTTSRPATVCGVPLPPRLRESDRLPAPIFTPATKAQSGHDINISEAEAGRIVGDQLVAIAPRADAALYADGAAHAESCGIILADTKFEFGLDAATAA